LRSGVGLLALFILLRGSDSTVLKLLQQAGMATQAAGGPVAISFCNVFFFSSLITGLVLLLSNRHSVLQQLPVLSLADRQLLALQSFSGFFLGPMCFYLALDRLSVVQQTLLFSLTVPASAVLAWLLLQERLPRTFPLSCAFITCGLLLAGQSRLDGTLDQVQTLDLRGVLWALLGVIAFGCSAVLNRIGGTRQLGVGLTVGVTSLAASGAFAAIALLLFGPSHFLYLRSWWVLGVIGGYALLITLGSQWSLLQSYARVTVAQISFWASLTIVVAIAEAHLFLNEPLHGRSLLGAGLIVIAVGLHQLNAGSGTQEDNTRFRT
jgi:drug/metabolite transporter (DMT)-like permease